jgi:hypothetical protein
MTSLDSKIINQIRTQNYGAHITIYLQKDSVPTMKRNLSQIIKEAHILLSRGYAQQQVEKYLEPIIRLCRNTSMLKNIKGNIGMFRTIDSFRIISIPINIENECIVASSFHIKPIMIWAQNEKEFCLVGSFKNEGFVYQGNSSQMNLKEITSLSELVENYKYDKNYFGKRVFFAGPKEQMYKIFGLEVSSKSKIKYVGDFNPKTLQPLHEKISKYLKLETQFNLNSSIFEYNDAEELGLAKKNIFQIAKNAIQGRVKKLIIAEDYKIWGKLDKQTGGLQINPTQLDHEDDDILDDIAQVVLEKGGEVILQPTEKMPQRRPILAILKPYFEEEKRQLVVNEFNIELNSVA